MASHTLAMSHGRRLFELLGQQQEPFLLEVYLLENGCSCRSLKSDTLQKCWPLNSCKKLLDFNSFGFKERRVGSILSCLLPKIADCKLLRKFLNCHTRAPDFPTKTVFKRNDESFWKMMQESKQLSPVSILEEFHSDEGCTFQNPSSSSNTEKAVEIPIKYRESSSTKPLLLRSENSEIPLYSACCSNSYQYSESSSNALVQSKQLLLQCVKELEKSVWKTHESLGQGQVFSFEKQRSKVHRIEQFVDEDLFNSRSEWGYFQAEKTEIEMEIEEFIFEDIKEESVLEMLRSNYLLERS